MNLCYWAAIAGQFSYDFIESQPYTLDGISSCHFLNIMCDEEDLEGGYDCACR